MFGFILTMPVLGLVAGFLARALVPGRDPMGLGQMILLGVVGGFLGYALVHKDSVEGALQPSGNLGSVLGAVIALLIWRRVAPNNHALR